MRELSEQEKKAREQAFDAWQEKSYWLTPNTGAFTFAFAAGLDYQQAEVERLQAAINKLGYHINYECGNCGTRYDVTYSSWPNCPACEENV